MRTLLADLVIEPLAELVRLDTLADLLGTAGLAALVLSVAALVQHAGGLP